MKESKKQKRNRRAGEHKSSLAIKIPYRLFNSKVISVDAMLFLQDLITRNDKSRFAEVSSVRKDKKRFVITEGVREYFLCTGEYLQDDRYPVWTLMQQGRHFKTLKRMGFVKTKLRGIPPCRWVHIDHDAIDEAVDTALDVKVPGKWTANPDPDKYYWK